MVEHNSGYGHNMHMQGVGQFGKHDRACHMLDYLIH